MRTLLAASVLLLACTGNLADRAALRSGTFHYAARSPDGAPLLRGTLDITLPDDSSASGNWSIAWVAGADTTVQVGPQVGSGELVGTRYGDTLVIQLNPTYADNNVVLLAVATADGYTGRWEWITITGPRTSGSFLAVPQ